MYSWPVHMYLFVLALTLSLVFLCFFSTVEFLLPTPFIAYALRIVSFALVTGVFLRATQFILVAVPWIAYAKGLTFLCRFNLWHNTLRYYILFLFH